MSPQRILTFAQVWEPMCRGSARRRAPRGAMLTHVMLTTTLEGRCHGPRFTEENTEAQGRGHTASRWWSLDLNPGSLASDTVIIFQPNY